MSAVIIKTDVEGLLARLQSPPQSRFKEAELIAIGVCDTPNFAVRRNLAGAKSFGSAKSNSPPRNFLRIFYLEIKDRVSVPVSPGWCCAWNQADSNRMGSI